MSELINKRILVVNAGPIYPVRAMNQMRTHNMIMTLSKNFKIDLLTPYIDEETFNQSNKAMESIGGKFIPVKSSKHKDNLIKKRIHQLLEYLNYYLFGIDKEVTANKRNNKKFLNIIREAGYRVVISNYWEASLYFKKLDDSIFKILDPHYAVKENLAILEKRKNEKVKYYFEKRRLSKNLKMEKEVIESSGLLLPLSEHNLNEFRKISPEKQMLLIPDGADLDYFFSFPSNPESDTILFYGAMGSDQNKRAFWRLYKNILPDLRMEFPGLKLLIVGSSPPAGIKELHNGKNIIVTGFVEDVRPWLAKAWLSIIPLEFGSGFRGRVIELMAMGIPIVGTHNALDSIKLKTGEEGYINDSDAELILLSIKLLKDSFLRNELGSNARKFVKVNYSLESTFGELNKYLKARLFNKASI